MDKNLQNALNEAVSSQLTGKKWYESKTFWANLVMAGAVAIQSKYGFVVGPELQALFITGVNMLLRKITKQPVVWWNEANWSFWRTLWI